MIFKEPNKLQAIQVRKRKHSGRILPNITFACVIKLNRKFWLNEI